MGALSLTCGMCCCYGMPFNILGIVFSLVALAQIRNDPRSQDGWGMAVAGLLSAGMAVLVYWVARTLKRRSHPLRPGQLVWGPGAFYTGSARMGLSSNTSVYKAVRPEWIAALARANPEQVDDAAYQALTGSARPAVPPDSRPFGPG